MASTSSHLKLIKTCYRIRSVSFPSKSNPVMMQKIEHELNKLKTEWKDELSTSTITAALSSLVKLYGYLDEVLNLSSTKQPFVENRDKLLGELLDGSLRLLDLSTSARDLVVRLKDSVWELRSSLRRTKRESSVEAAVGKYLSSRKEIMRIAKDEIQALTRGFEYNLEESNTTNSLHSVIKALRCVSLINVSICESLLLFLAVPPAAVCRKLRWSSLMSKLTVLSTSKKGHYQNGHELKSIESLLIMEQGDEEGSSRIKVVQSRLEGLEIGLEEMEGGLDRLLRQLIKTRATLLNVISF